MGYINSQSTADGNETEFKKIMEFLWTSYIGKNMFDVPTSTSTDYSIALKKIGRWYGNQLHRNLQIQQFSIRGA